MFPHSKVPSQRSLPNSTFSDIRHLRPLIFDPLSKTHIFYLRRACPCWDQCGSIALHNGMRKEMPSQSLPIQFFVNMFLLIFVHASLSRNWFRMTFLVPCYSTSFTRSPSKCTHGWSCLALLFLHNFSNVPRHAPAKIRECQPVLGESFALIKV